MPGRDKSEDPSRKANALQSQWAFYNLQSIKELQTLAVQDTESTRSAVWLRKLELLEEKATYFTGSLSFNEDV